MTRTIAVSEIREKLRKAYRSLDDPLFARCLDELPAVPPQALCFFMDGNKRCCVHGDFRNLQEDPAGFGDTDDEAYRDLLRQLECETCGGDGRVTENVVHTVDRGSKWQRSATEQVQTECPTCDGTGISR